MILVNNARTYARLGWRNLIDVGLYRIGLKTGVHPVLKIPVEEIPKGDFFPDVRRVQPLPSATLVWREGPWAFGQPLDARSDEPPDWHANIFTGIKVQNAEQHWSKASAFCSDVGDIKTVWEASRFDWVVAFAQHAASGDASALAKLNRWLIDWNNQNPAYRGPNWMCGQEASIRVAHLVLAAILIGSTQSISNPLEAMLVVHLRRIMPTIAYARGQDNNHATSEAMALYTGGLWLYRYSEDDEVRIEARKYMQAGLNLAEDRAQRLIMDDGGFAQYSFVYHRLMLDSISLMELVRRKFDAPPFSKQFMRKAAAASAWLRFFTEPGEGDVPNMGSNDSAWLMPIGCGMIRDFRPSCALASTLFEGLTVFSKADSAHALLCWIDVQAEPLADLEPRPSVRLFPNSAIAAISTGDLRIYLRLPGTEFRPHQADALHIDVWQGSKNLLFDAGTFSYAEPGWDYFPSTAAHNTIEFDNREQMPRLGRFLYGEWLKRDSLEIDNDSTAPYVRCGYTDYKGAKHLRSVCIKDGQIIIVDEISGQFQTARIRWRTSSQSKCLVMNNENVSLVTQDALISLNYYNRKDVKILEAELPNAGRYTTCLQT